MLNYIHDYRRRLDDLRRIAGADNEGTLSAAFAGLLEVCGQEHKLVLAREWPFRGRDGALLRADGVLLDRLRLAHGWWEAKDSKDHLDREIEAKLSKGYPSDNILFEDTVRAVLLQNGQEVRRVLLTDDAGLTALLERFFAFRPPEVEQFEQAAAQFRRDLPTVLDSLVGLIGQREADNAAFRARLGEFHQLCVRAIGARVTPGHVREMLIQHILTEQIFRDLFPASAFHQENHLARALSEVEQAFLRGETRQNLLRRMEPYYAAIRRAAANAVAATEKQEFLKAVYEDFYTAYNPRDADRMGIVYTPAEVVRFIIQGCDTLARTHFGRGLADEGLDILDPCTGTGTFIVELLDYLRGDRAALARKFAGEIHANEIAILPYYIACLNIEQTFADIAGDWREFAGACFMDTLANWGFEKAYSGAQGDLLGSITDENQQRIREQNARRIPVIIGNPPYNANQQNENDNNKNVAAPEADARIKATYLAASNAQKTKLYDPYVRFFRWAADRIGEEGIIGFISNSSFIDARGFDGFRKVAAQEFQEIYVIDMKGNARTSGERRKQEAGNVFDDKIRVGVAIYFFVRNPRREDCNIWYLAVDDFLKAIEKRRFLATHSLVALRKQGAFQRVLPNAAGNWINQPKNDWSGFLPIATKEAKLEKSEYAIFKLFSNGINSARDEWIYAIDIESIDRKVSYIVRFYDAIMKNEKADDGGIKWSRNLKRKMEQGKKESFSRELINKALYRPFVKLFFYRSSLFIDEQGSIDKVFPLGSENLALSLTHLGSNKPFSILAVSVPVDWHFLGDTFLLPLNCYPQDGSRIKNITDWSLSQFRAHYSDPTLTKLDIFHYVYAVLHDPVYRDTYALNLKRELPRIPFYPAFRQWAAWGEQLMTLHLGFESIEPWPLQRMERPYSPPRLRGGGAKRRGGLPAEPDNHPGADAPPLLEKEGNKLIVPKPRLKADKTAGRIEIDEATVLENIPPEAWEYRLGHRSALEWILEEYKETTPRDPTIREKFNTYRFAAHKETVIDLLMRVCRVSVETVKIIASMKLMPRNEK